jgi:hypothetical protein
VVNTRESFDRLALQPRERVHLIPRRLQLFPAEAAEAGGALAGR